MFRGYLGILPPIKLHVWGGFGSQVFALLACRRIAKVYPGRRIALVFHSSGVTERLNELPESFLIGLQVVQKKDFSTVKNKTIENNSGAYSSYITKLIKHVLSLTGLFSRLENEKDFSNLRWWVLTVRGHYTKLAYSHDELKYLVNLMNLSLYSEVKVGTAVHLRLGDLLHLTSKTFIPMQRIEKALKLISDRNSIHIYSDSTPQIASRVWKNSIQSNPAIFYSKTPLETVYECSLRTNFVGTNSKLSVLIALCRIYLNSQGNSILPIEIYDQVIINSSLIKSGASLSCY